LEMSAEMERWKVFSLINMVINMVQMFAKGPLFKS